jgi:hypothetical protein
LLILAWLYGWLSYRYNVAVANDPVFLYLAAFFLLQAQGFSLIVLPHPAQTFLIMWPHFLQ